MTFSEFGHSESQSCKILILNDLDQNRDRKGAHCKAPQNQIN